jgi:hypothetical protein
MILARLMGLPEFSAIQITAAYERVHYFPRILGAMGEGLAQTVRASTRQIAIGRSDGYMALIPTSPIGAPPVELELKPTEIRAFTIHRLAKGSTLVYESMTGLALKPEFQQVADVQAEIVNRGVRIRGDMENTHEHMRLGMVRGVVLDADGVTVLEDWFDLYDIPRPTPINFALNTATPNLRDKCRAVRNIMIRESKGGWIEGRTVAYALCGDDFYRKLITHAEVERTYMNWAAAQDLRAATLDEFSFGGIVFLDYRGSDDGSMAVAADEARFFPVGGDNVFQRILGPAEFDPFINQPGQDIYALTIPDRDRGAWVRVEAYNYPLYVCMRPEMLQIGKAQ